MRGGFLRRRQQSGGCGGILEVQNFERGTVGLPGDYSTFLWLRWVQRVVVSLAEALAMTKCTQA